MSDVVQSAADRAPAAQGASAAAASALDSLIDNLPAILAIVGCIVLWQLVVWGFSVPTFMAPSPIAVIGAFKANAGTLFANFLPTLMEAVLGFLVGNVVAVLLASGSFTARLLKRRSIRSPSSSSRSPSSPSPPSWFSWWATASRRRSSSRR